MTTYRLSARFLERATKEPVEEAMRALPVWVRENLSTADLCHLHNIMRRAAMKDLGAQAVD